MTRMRTIDQAFDYVRSADNETALTKTALRRLVVTGKLPSVKVGQKYLISLDRLDEFMYGEMDRTLENKTVNGIRRLSV